MSTTTKQFDANKLKQLMYAVANIGGNASPDTDEGVVFSESALAMADRLFLSDNDVRKQMIASGYGATAEQCAEFDPVTVEIDRDTVDEGCILAVKLWLECMTSTNPWPASHADEQIARGLAGERVEP